MEYLEISEVIVDKKVTGNGECLPSNPVLRFKIFLFVDGINIGKFVDTEIISNNPIDLLGIV